MLDEKGAKNLFDNIMNLWVLPEIERRRKNDQISGQYILSKAQVVFNPKSESIVVRLNEEVKASATAKIKKGVSKRKGEPVYEGEIEEIQDIKLTEEDDPDSGHVTMMQFRGNWIIHFNFRYYKSRLQYFLRAAEEFLLSARTNKKENLTRPFIDNIFSAIEMMAVCQLYNRAGNKFQKKRSHRLVQRKYNDVTRLGNFKPEYKEVLNKLAGLRDGARYIKRDFKLSDKDAEEYLSVAEDMMEYTKRFVGVSSKS